MTDALLALAALFGVPAALVTLIALTALTLTRRREHDGQAPSPTSRTGRPGAQDPATRHAWTAAHMAHVRITHLEARIRRLEAQNAPTGSDRR